MTDKNATTKDRWNFRINQRGRLRDPRVVGVKWRRLIRRSTCGIAPKPRRTVARRAPTEMRRPLLAPPLAVLSDGRGGVGVRSRRRKIPRSKYRRRRRRRNCRKHLHSEGNRIFGDNIGQFRWLRVLDAVRGCRWGISPLGHTRSIIFFPPRSTGNGNYRNAMRRPLHVHPYRVEITGGGRGVRLGGR